MNQKIIALSLLTLLAIGTESPTKAVDTIPISQQLSLENHANAPEEVPDRKGMAYKDARKLFIKKGWQPNLQGTPPNLRNRFVKELFDLGYEEIKDCSGTGEGLCRFEFINRRGELLVVVASTMESKSTELLVRNFWIEKKN